MPGRAVQQKPRLALTATDGIFPQKVTFDGNGRVFLSYKPYSEQKTGAFSALPRQRIFRIFTIEKLLFYTFYIFFHR